MSRRERLELLLANLQDARAGIRDRGSDGEHGLPLMCRVWNHPSYQQLEELLPVLRSEEPRLARALADRYLGPQRRVFVCPRCAGTQPAWSSVNFHKHAGKNIALVPKIIRLTPRTFRPELAEAAVDWLDERWEGGVFVPDELLVSMAVT